MEKIQAEYDEKSLIRKEEMQLLWGEDHLPPDSLVDYWHKTLKIWLDEYVNGVKKLPLHDRLLKTSYEYAKSDFSLGIIEVRKGEIIRLAVGNDDTGDEILVIPLSRKEQDEVAVWMCCPISKYSVPATMWEFYGRTKMEEPIVLQAWNLVPIKEEELLKIGRIPEIENNADEYTVTDDTIDMVLHSFERMSTHQYQDIPMTEVGPRVFRTNDPRLRYQREERNKFKAIIYAANAKEKEENLKSELSGVEAQEHIKEN